MGLLQRFEEIRAAWPTSGGVVERWNIGRGHDDSRFSPVEYGDYIATSNDIYSIVQLRAKNIGRLPIRLYDKEGPDKREVTRGDLFDLLRTVNPFWTPVRLKQQTEMSLCLWGEAFWVLERDPLGIPRELWWVKPTQMTPVPHPTKYLSGFEFTPADQSRPIPFTPNEVIWFRYPNPLDEFSPLSPLAAARLAADTSAAMMKSNKRLFDDGMQLAGAMVPPKGVTYSAEQAKALERQLEERYRGVDKAHRWAVLRFEAQMQPFGVTPKDAEFVNGLNITLRQACNAYGVPSPLLNDLEHATLANVREFHTMLWEDALVPECEFLAEDFREQLLPQFPRTTRPVVNHVEFDTSGISALREAENAVWERENGQIQAGALLINEWRTAHGKPKVPWGDTWWAPVNKAPIDSEGQVAPATAPGEDFTPATPEEQSANRLALAHLRALSDALEPVSANGH